jgi:hypothetical protein
MTADMSERAAGWRSAEAARPGNEMGTLPLERFERQ